MTIAHPFSLRAGWLSMAHVLALALPESEIALLEKANRAGRGAPNLLQEGLTDKAAAVAFLQELTEPIVLGDRTLFPGSKWRLLANIGVRDVLEEAYASYLTSNDEWTRARIFNSFGEIWHPEFMVVVSQHVFDAGKNGGPGGEPKVGLKGEFTGYEVPYGNAFTILRITGHSGLLPADVEAWARSVEAKHGGHNPIAYLDEVRAFWSENGAMIAAGLYDQVRPPSIARAAQPSSEASPPAFHAAPVTSAPAAPVIAELQAARARWPWLLGGGALLIIVSFGIRHRRSRNKESSDL